MSLAHSLIWGFIGVIITLLLLITLRHRFLFLRWATICVLLFTVVFLPMSCTSRVGFQTFLKGKLSLVNNHDLQFTAELPTKFKTGNNKAKFQIFGAPLDSVFIFLDD